MPISLQIHHPDRMVVILVRGAVVPQDLDGAVAELIAGSAFHFRKIVDVTGAFSGLTDADLAAFSERIRTVPPDLRTGPIAIVTDHEHNPMAELFAALAGDKRPVKVFASIHTARQWLHANSRIS